MEPIVLFSAAVIAVLSFVSSGCSHIGVPDLPSSDEKCFTVQIIESENPRRSHPWQDWEFLRWRLSFWPASDCTVCLKEFSY